MRLPPIKRFLMEDFQTEASWIGRLIIPLNTFMTIMTNGLDNGMTISENMLAQIKTISVSGATSQTSFLWPFQIKPIGCHVIACTKADGTPFQNPGVTFTFSQGLVQVTLTGLSPTDNYFVTFHVIGG